MFLTRILALWVVLVSIPFGQAAVSHARISEKSAEAVAKKAQPGEVVRHELKHRRGKWIYSFSIRDQDKKIHHVQVDARSGKVIAQDRSKFDSWGIAGRSG